MSVMMVSLTLGLHLLYVYSLDNVITVKTICKLRDIKDPDSICITQK